MTVDLLVMAPHPDDAEMCCGGLMLLAKKAGKKVGVVDITGGEMGTRGSVEERKKEAAAASEFLGVDARENLGLPDGRLMDDQDLRTAIVKMLRKYRPSTLCIPYWDDMHPDHAAVGQAGQYAAWLCGAPNYDSESAEGITSPDRPPYRPKRVLFYQNRYGIDADLVIDVTSVIEEKLKLVSCFASQFGSEWKKMTSGGEEQPVDDAPQTLLSSDKFPKWFRGIHASYGRKIQVEYGEAYCLKNPVPIFNLKAFLE